MYEQEKHQAAHLLVLLSCTILTIGLTGESILLGWDTGAIVLLLLGIAACWALHITEAVPESIRLWLYFALSMLAFFFYGIHETSIFDLAPMMIVIIIVFSVTEMYSIIRLCVVVYFLTMCYDFVFVVKGIGNFDSLEVTRTILHLVLVFMAGYLMKVMIHKRNVERKNVEKRITELEEANRRTEDFLTNVSHELRTPINAVTGITTVMLKNEEDTDKRKNLLSIQMAGHRLFSQIEDILDYTELDTGRIKISDDTYMISSLVNDIITGNRLYERENMPEMIFDVDTKIPSVLSGDGRKIKKILVHLIDNAIKFTNKGGVYIRIYALPKSYGINLYMQVSDTGVGIAREDLGKITEQFYQSNGGRNRSAGGLGLGLPIVYGMVTAMGGFMQIDSEFGKGTTVSVSIPQKIVDETGNMIVMKRNNLCLACFVVLEKFEVPEVRDYYNAMISHLVQELDIPLHRVSNMEELKKLNAMYQLTHLFVGRKEYEDNQSYFENMDKKIEIVVVTDNGFVPHQGSRVRVLKKPFFCLPLMNILNTETPEDEETLKEKQMICPGVKVLVVDDEPMNLMVSEGIFGDYQMSVKTAESGKKAIELCEKEDFDLIFLDHMMPEMDGVETLKRIRKIHTDSGREFTIIAFTANAVSGAREMFLREGFDEFVSKPIETMEIERVLRKVLPKSAIEFVDESDTKGKETERKTKVAEENTAEEAIAEESVQQEESGLTEGDSMTRLENAGIHTKSGLQYCRDDREFYVELLAKFAGDAASKRKEIDDFLKQDDYENYGILVHSLKSTAKLIGADQLSEMARKSEEGAKNHDEVYVKEHHEELLAAYQETVQRILDALDIDESGFMPVDIENATEISRDDLIRRLKELKSCLDTFEADKAETLISEMRGFVYQGVTVDELLHSVRQDVDDFEISAASEKVQSLLGDMEGSEA